MAQKICFPFIGDSVGGAHISALHLIDNLDKDKFEPEIILHEEGALADFLQKKHITYHLLPLRHYAGTKPSVFSILFASLHAFFALRCFLKRENFQIIHSNDLRTNLTWVLAAKYCKIPMIWHQRARPHSNSFIWRLVPYMVSHCLAISKTTARPLGIKNARVTIIENPFEWPEQKNIDALKADLLDEIGATPKERLIGCIGRLVASKRPDLCIEALASLPLAQRHKCHLLFIGKGHPEFISALHEKAMALKMDQHVHFLGFRYPVHNLISALDIVIAPSEQEGFGRVIVEAMLAGTAVVASAIDAHKEIIIDENKALLAVTGNADSFATQINHLLCNEKLRKALIKTARNYAHQRFATKNHYIAIQAIYTKLLGM